MKIRAVLAGLALLVTMSSVANANQVGQSRRLKDGKGNLMRVTLLKVNASMRSTNQFEKPDAGKRFYGLFVRITNLSGAKLDDCAGNDSVLTNRAGEKFETAFATIDPSLACYKLLPHRQAQGWVIFSVPTKGKPAFFDWTPDSGFADATADFQL
jgi:hypothetical protein